MTRKDGGALSIQPKVVRKVERDVGRRLVIGIKDAVVVVVPVRRQFCIFDLIKVRICPGVVVIIGVDGIRSCGGVGWVGDTFAIAEVVVVPGVGGIAVKASGPEQHFVFIVHSVFVVVFVHVVSSAIVVVVERCSDTDQKFGRVGKAVAVPVVVSPVRDAVVVVVPGGLLFAPETSLKLLLVDVQASIVVVIGVFPIRYTVVVVVNVIDAWRTQALRHDTLVPNSLVETVVISVCIVSVIVVVIAI